MRRATDQWTTIQIHLEGSLEPPSLFQLAHENGIALPSPSEDPAFVSVKSLRERYQQFSSLDDFLHYYFIGMSVLIKASDFETLAWEYFLRAKKDGVVHAEVFFDPQAHVGRGVAYSTMVDGLTVACRRARMELNITTELIVCFLRHLPLSSAEDMYQQTLPDLKAGLLSGIGLSSTEKGNPPHLFRSIYASAEADRIRRTAHAGEEGDVGYMRGALEALKVQRVDYGIRLADDLTLMAEFVKRQIMVTMCPLSNVRLRCVKEVKLLPVRTYLDNGVKFSINSDDPAYFGGYILANYCAVQEAFDLRIDEWHDIVKTSIGGSWCSESRKSEMLEMLERMTATTNLS